MKLTLYFQEQVLRKRTYLTIEMCRQVIASPLKSEKQLDGRVRFWGKVNERYLRVVTLEDELTIHNAFYDRDFEPPQTGENT